MKARYDAQMSQSAGITTLFNERKAELEGFGVTADQAVRNLVGINDYANRNPSEYMTWFAQRMTGGDAAKQEQLLKGVVEKLGYKIEKAQPEAQDDAEDDPFMSDSERQLREELKQLRAQNAARQQPAPEIGPDSPQERLRQDVIGVINEAGPDGQPLRPHFQKLQPVISAIIQQKRAVNPTAPMGRAELVAAYEQAVMSDPELGKAEIERQVQERIAAQTSANVQEQVQRSAAAAQKAGNASKLIDRPGQSATTRPATGNADPNMGIRDFLEANWKD